MKRINLTKKQALNLPNPQPWIQYPEIIINKKMVPFGLIVDQVKRAAFILHLSNVSTYNIAYLLNKSRRTIRDYIKAGYIKYPYIKKS